MPSSWEIPLRRRRDASAAPIRREFPCHLLIGLRVGRSCRGTAANKRLAPPLASRAPENSPQPSGSVEVIAVIAVSKVIERWRIRHGGSPTWQRYPPAGTKISATAPPRTKKS